MGRGREGVRGRGREGGREGGEGRRVLDDCFNACLLCFQQN